MAATKGKKLVALATGAGVFVDERTRLKVVPGASVELDEARAGEQTLSALKFGHLVETEAAAEKKQSTETSDELPKDLPLRDALIKAGIKTVSDLKKVKTADLEKIPGVDDKGGKAIFDFLQATK